MHDSLKVLLPATSIVMVSEPDVAFDPSQAPDATHAVALVVDQVRVVVEVMSTSSGEAFSDTVAAGGPPPPPPPPPQAARLTLTNAIKSIRNI